MSGWFTGVFGVSMSEAGHRQPPNIIMLMADDLGYGDVGYNGNPKIITPNLDEMSRTGMVLNRFYAASPLCSPTRASCLTGRDPFRQGILAAHTAGMRIGETTVAEVLKEQGYRTGFFGKWHLGWVEPDKPDDRGFYSPPWHHGFEEVFATKSAVPTYDPTVYPDNWDGWGKGEGDAWGGSIYVHNGVPVTDNLDGDDSRIIMDRVIPFLEQALKENKPFLATLWFHAPHEPVVAGPEYLAMYPDLPERQRHFYGCITAMDEQIGRLRDFLSKHQISENTVVFFCSDNGPAGGLVGRGIASAGPFRGRKHQVWEGGLRVPSLVEWPGQVEPGSVSHFPAGTSDYFPTILDIVGIAPNPDVPLDGISLLPLLTGGTLPLRPPMAFGFQRLYQDTQRFALIDGYNKIVIHDDAETELFNLKTDPAESNNLANENPDLLKAMTEKLEAIQESWRKSRGGNDFAY